MVDTVRKITDRTQVENMLAEAGVPEVFLQREHFFSRKAFNHLKAPRFFLVTPVGSYSYGGCLAIVDDWGIRFSQARSRAKRINQKKEYDPPYLWDMSGYSAASYQNLVWDDGTLHAMRKIGDIGVTP